MSMAKSLAEGTALRELLAGQTMTKGQTRLLDIHLTEAILKNGGSFLEIMRDPEWLDGPVTKLGVCFRTMPASSAGQPLIETAMSQLRLLRDTYDSSGPKQELPEAARELKKRVRELQ